MKTMGLKVRRVTISIDPIVLKFVDEERGLIKRSTYIDYLLKKQILPILKERQKKGITDGNPE